MSKKTSRSSMVVRKLLVVVVLVAGVAAYLFMPFPRTFNLGEGVKEFTVDVPNATVIIEQGDKNSVRFTTAVRKRNAQSGGPDVSEENGSARITETYQALSFEILPRLAPTIVVTAKNPEALITRTANTVTLEPLSVDGRLTLRFEGSHKVTVDELRAGELIVDFKGVNEATITGDAAVQSITSKDASTDETGLFPQPFLDASGLTGITASAWSRASTILLGVDAIPSATVKKDGIIYHPEGATIIQGEESTTGTVEAASVEKYQQRLLDVRQEEGDRDDIIEFYY